MSSLAQVLLPADKPHIITTRHLAAPRALVWKVLTTPEHLKHFWGPDGFTNSYSKFDLHVGGQALFIMHGPDGTDYPNRFIFRTVEAPRFLAFDHDGGEGGAEDHSFKSEIELFDEGDKTRIELRVFAQSMAQRDTFVSFGATEGGKQNLDRLAAFVAPMAEAKNLFEIERTFPVAQERLFKACTRVEELQKWMAPPGMTVLKAEQNLKPGGHYHYGLGSGQGNEMWGMVTYKEITPNSRLVYLQSFSDPQGNLTRHPMAPHWPLEMVTVFDFIPEGAKQTKLKISWIYAGTDDAEGETFRAAHASMNGGWTGTLDNLGAFLARDPAP